MEGEVTTLLTYQLFMRNAVSDIVFQMVGANVGDK